MTKLIPDNWNSLNVGNDLGLRGDYPRNLVVYKVKGTDKLSCRYLPAEVEVMIQSKQENKQLFGVRNKENNYKKQQKERNINLGTLFTSTGIFGGRSSRINLINQQEQKETLLINGMEKVGV